MFDDQPPKTSGVVPPNLPIGGEPEDIFSKVVPDEPPSAFEAGILKPARREPGPPAPTPVQQPSVQVLPKREELSNMDSGMDPVKVSRGIMPFIIVIVVILVLGGVGWWVYAAFFSDAGPGGNVPEVVDTDIPPIEDFDVRPVEEGLVETTDENTVTVDEEILFGALDQDDDGLDDNQEALLQTDPLNWDTDGDGLSDYEEVNVWKTNPLSPDSDGDTYLDGQEVKAGYDPAGPGRYLIPPTTTP